MTVAIVVDDFALAAVPGLDADLVEVPGVSAGSGPGRQREAGDAGQLLVVLSGELRATALPAGQMA